MWVRKVVKIVIFSTSKCSGRRRTKNRIPAVVLKNPPQKTPRGGIISWSKNLFFRVKVKGFLTLNKNPPLDKVEILSDGRGFLLNDRRYHNF